MPVQSILRSVYRLVIFLFCCLASLAQAEDELLQAAAAQARGEYRIAAEAYARALTNGYDSAELRSNYGVALHLAGEDVKALEQFRIALHRKPGLVAAYLFAGLCLLHLARPHEAVPLLERASAADTSGIAPLLALGQAYVSIRDFRRANNAYLEATQRDPRSAQAWYGVGITRRSLAESLLRDATRHGKTKPEEATELLRNALDSLNRAVALDPDAVQAHLMLAESLRDSGKYVEAIPEYETAIRLRPEMTAGYLGLATTYWKYGPQEKLTQPLERALNLSPKDPEANSIMGNVLVRQGDYARAKPYLETALAGNSDLAETRVSLAKIQLAENRPERAIAELQRVLAEDTDGNYHFLYYRALKQAGHAKEAEHALQEFNRLRSLAAKP
ncbi:MAG: hypothetical protein DMG57_11710 [Acidobacteria bacterium]|nr:MAG: hypothetical protein DMG57_11710 [Acidobacteriota bacterium]